MDPRYKLGAGLRAKFRSRPHSRLLNLNTSVAFLPDIVGHLPAVVTVWTTSLLHSVVFGPLGIFHAQLVISGGRLKQTVADCNFVELTSGSMNITH